MPESLTQCLSLFALYALAGWLLEVFYRTISQRRFVNPGFLHGPFIPLYGFGALFVVAIEASLAGFPLILRFLALGVSLSALEYSVGALLEKILHLRLWDYTDNRLNIHGRVCFSFSAFWAALALGFARLIHPSVATWFACADGVVLQSVAIIFFIYFCIDVVVSAASFRVFRAVLARVQAEYFTISDAENRRLLAKVKRLRDAFPLLNSRILQRLNRGIHLMVAARPQEGDRVATTEAEQRGTFEEEHRALVSDIIEHPEFLRLKGFFHHDSSIYEHACRVSYSSYRLCKQLRLDYRSAARGGLLHDFFLYDWRDHDVPDLPRSEFHGIAHPKIALAKAESIFFLNDIERDCIEKHMWPLTLVPPRFKESWAVSLVDKYQSSREFVSRRARRRRSPGFKSELSPAGAERGKEMNCLGRKTTEGPTRRASNVIILFLLMGASLCASSCLGHTRQNLAAGCHADNHHDCLTLGFMLLKGQDGRMNPQEALKYFVRSCELGNSIGCRRAGKLWESGATGFESPRKAQMYYRMAQELDEQERKESAQ